MHPKTIETLLEQRRVFSEHIAFLAKLENDLDSDRREVDASELWGLAALASLLPVNILMNAIAPGMKVATQSVAGMVKAVYESVAKSGKTYRGVEKPLVDAIQKAAIEVLKSSKAAEFVPVVNVLVGMYYDTMALMQYQKDVAGARAAISGEKDKIKAQIRKSRTYLMIVDGEVTKWFETADKVSRSA